MIGQSDICFASQHIGKTKAFCETYSCWFMRIAGNNITQKALTLMHNFFFFFFNSVFIVLRQSWLIVADQDQKRSFKNVQIVVRVHPLHSA